MENGRGCFFLSSAKTNGRVRLALRSALCSDLFAGLRHFSRGLPNRMKGAMRRAESTVLNGQVRRLLLDTLGLPGILARKVCVRAKFLRDGYAF